MASKLASRQRFMADVRREQAFASLSFIYGVSEATPPLRGDIKEVGFAEPNIPRILKRLSAHFCQISTVLKPTQEMVNIISDVLGRAAAFPPPLKPYGDADYTQQPWLPMISLHINAL